MSLRKRIRLPTQAIGGGGGPSPTPPLVAWGPDFGETPGNDGKTYGVGVNTDLDQIALAANLGVGVNTDLDAIALTANLGVGVSIYGEVLGAPFLQGVGVTTQTANSPTVTMTPDQTADDGDFLIVSICSTSALGATETFTAPSGWTLLRSSQHSSGLNAPRILTYYKFAGASEPGSYSWTNGQNTAHAATILRLIGVSASTPINVHAASEGSATDPVSPSITTTAINCFMLSICSQYNALTQTYTPPSGYVENADQAASNVGVVAVTSETASRVKAATGASGTATHNSDQILASNYVCHHIAIAPGPVVIT